jgi:hypothetical protein
MIFYTTILAWISAFLIYQIGSLFIWYKKYLHTLLLLLAYI